MSNKQKRFSIAVALVVGLAGTGTAGAALTNWGGGIIYDNVLDVVWLQDANYSATSNYDGNGLMTWMEALDWAAQLEYGGYDDWRLPTMGPVDGDAYHWNFTYDGSTDYSYNISYPGRISPPDLPGAYPYSTQNEMAYMFYVNLDNLGRFKVDGTPRDGLSGIDWGLTNTSFEDDSTGDTISFRNLQSYGYWSDVAINEFSASALHFNSGFNDSHGKTGRYFAWAVRDAGMVVPIPSALPLFLSALLGLAGVSINQRRQSP